MFRQTQRRRVSRRAPALRRAGAASKKPRLRRAMPLEDADRARPKSSVGENDRSPSGYPFLAMTVMTPALLGAAAAMATAGADVGFRALFAGETRSAAPITPMVVGAVLMALAVGVRVPQRFALWACVRVWRRVTLRGQSSDLSRVWFDPSASNRSLHWSALSAIALAAGVLIAMMPLSMRAASATYAWLHVHFVWSSGPLAILNAGLVFLTLLAPLSVLGLAVACAHHLSCRFGQWETTATGWVLIGAAGGGVASSLLAEHVGRADLMLVAAALPALSIALISAAAVPFLARESMESGETRQPDPLPLPACSDQWSRLLRLGVVGVSGGGACALALWLQKLFGDGVPIGLTVPAMLFAAGVGVLVGCRYGAGGAHSIGAFGCMCAVSGVVVGLYGLAPQMFVRMGSASAIVPACGGLAAIGFTTAYGRRALLDRVAHRSSAGSTILARVLVCSGVMVWTAAPMAKHAIGMAATLAVAGVLLVTLGGLLVIFDPNCADRVRRTRLCVLFGSIGFMIVLAFTVRLTS